MCVAGPSGSCSGGISPGYRVTVVITSARLGQLTPRGQVVAVPGGHGNPVRQLLRIRGGIREFPDAVQASGRQSRQQERAQLLRGCVRCGELWLMRQIFILTWSSMTCAAGWPRSWPACTGPWVRLCAGRSGGAARSGICSASTSRRSNGACTHSRPLGGTWSGRSMTSRSPRGVCNHAHRPPGPGAAQPIAPELMEG